MIGSVRNIFTLLAHVPEVIKLNGLINNPHTLMRISSRTVEIDLQKAVGLWIKKRVYICINI